MNHTRKKKNGKMERRGREPYGYGDYNLMVMAD